MTEKNIFFNNSICNPPPPEKIHPLFPINFPLKGLPFSKFGRRLSSPLQAGRKG